MKRVAFSVTAPTNRMATKCLARRCKEGPSHKIDLSGTQGSFHLELDCDGTCVAGKEICQECLGRKQVGKHKNQSKSWQGLIGGEFPEWSRIVGSAKYLVKLKENGLPTPDDMGRPKKVVEASAVTQTAVKEKKPRAKKAIKIKDEVIAPVVPVAPVTPTPMPMPIVTKAVQSNEPTVYDVDVKVIKVRRLEVGGRSYFLDPNKYKVYKVGSDKKPGAYHGRWNPETEEMDTSFPDSDCEV